MSGILLRAWLYTTPGSISLMYCQLVSWWESGDIYPLKHQIATIYCVGLLAMHGVVSFRSLRYCIGSLAACENGGSNLRNTRGCNL